MAKKKLSKEEKLAKKLWPYRVDLPNNNEKGVILKKLYDEGYNPKERRGFYNKYIVDRVKDKQLQSKIDDRVRSTPDAEFVPTKENIFQNRLDARRKELKKKRGNPPSSLRKFGKKALEVLHYESPKQKKQRLRQEPSDDPTARQRDVSPKKGEFKKGGVVNRNIKRKGGGKVMSGNDLVSSLYD